MVRHDPAVPLDPGAHLDAAGMARVPGHELLVVVHHHLHRTPALARQRVGHGHVHEVALAAEVAADVAGMDHQAFERYLQRLGKLLAQGERSLAAGPELRRARRIHAHHAGVGLDVALVHGLRVERVLHDDVGLAEPLLDVPLAPGQVHEGVGGRFQRGHEALVVHHVRMDQRRRRLDRLQWVQHRLQILVFHLDELRRAFGGLLAVGRHRRHLLAHEADHVLRQDGHVAQPPAYLQPGHVGARDDRPDPGRLLRPARVDALDPSVGYGAPQHLAPRHVRKGHVHRVNRLARYLAHALRPGGRDSDLACSHWVTSVVWSVFRCCRCILARARIAPRLRVPTMAYRPARTQSMCH